MAVVMSVTSLDKVGVSTEYSEEETAVNQYLNHSVKVCWMGWTQGRWFLKHRRETVVFIL